MMDSEAERKMVGGSVDEAIGHELLGVGPKLRLVAVDGREGNRQDLALLDGNSCHLTGLQRPSSELSEWGVITEAFLHERSGELPVSPDEVVGARYRQQSVDPVAQGAGLRLVSRGQKRADVDEDLVVS